MPCARTHTRSIDTKQILSNSHWIVSLPLCLWFFYFLHNLVSFWSLQRLLNREKEKKCETSCVVVWICANRGQERRWCLENLVFFLYFLFSFISHIQSTLVGLNLYGSDTKSRSICSKNESKITKTKNCVSEKYTIKCFQVLANATMYGTANEFIICILRTVTAKRRWWHRFRIAVQTFEFNFINFVESLLRAHFFFVVSSSKTRFWSKHTHTRPFFIRTQIHTHTHAHTRSQRRHSNALTQTITTHSKRRPYWFFPFFFFR